LPPSPIAIAIRRGRGFPTLVNVILLDLVKISHILKESRELVPMLLVYIKEVSILRMRVAIRGYLIFISCIVIVVLTAKHKNRNRPGGSIISYHISFANNQASRDYADLRDLASKENARLASGIVGPSQNCAKVSNLLRNDFLV
jgi:hypothetical protein